ncbi:MAG: hypothetical protein Q3988_06310 [Gemella sp.]|nr:hypothetical protein [Gemella sp.]
MLKNLLIKIFIFIFTLVSVATFTPYNIALSSSAKTYIVPIKLSSFSTISGALPKNIALIKTAIIKEDKDTSSITLSLETKENTNNPNYILDIAIYDNNQLKSGKFFYRYFDEKSKTYIHQVQFERKSQKESQIKVNILSNEKTESSDVVIQIDWSKAKTLNTKKFADNVPADSEKVENIKTSINTNKKILTPNSIHTNSNLNNQPKQTSIPTDIPTNPAKMQDYINYYNNIKARPTPPQVSTTSITTTTTGKIEENPEDTLDENKDSKKKDDKPILRSVSDFFSSNTATKSAGSYIVEISSNHLNPLTGKLANENSKDKDLIKLLSRNIITPSIENSTNLKEILRQEIDTSEKSWARAGLDKKGDKLYATVRLHLINHITRSQEEGPFFKVLKENGQYELVTSTESHLNINKDGDSYADYTFEVPRENFSAMVQVNVESMNKTINFFIESNPRSIKKGTMSNAEQSKSQPASPLLKTIILALVLLLVIIIPLLVIRRKRQLEEDEYEEYDNEDED